MRTKITSIGNAGFLVARGESGVAIDPLFDASLGIASGVLEAVAHLDVILITHSHWDHFDAEGVTRLAKRCGCVVVGPPSATRGLKGRLPAEFIREVSLPGPGAMASIRHKGMTVTAIRTMHGQEHLSYLVDMKGFRFFHDGDNEKTGCMDWSVLNDLDAILLCPWQGADWVRFLDTLAVPHWFIMHLSEEEIEQHERGEFFPDLCDHVPKGLVVLRPGESRLMEDGEAA